VHLELDELVDAWRRLGDDVAERAVALAAAPDGQSAAIAGSTKVEPLPGGHLGDREVVWLIANRLEQVTARTRERIARVASLDPVSEDLLIGAAGTLEKQLWMLRAQRADG
jgi:starvation-inducible DNA-binding protein